MPIVGQDRHQLWDQGSYELPDALDTLAACHLRWTSNENFAYLGCDFYRGLALAVVGLEDCVRSGSFARRGGGAIDYWRLDCGTKRWRQDLRPIRGVEGFAEWRLARSR